MISVLLASYGSQSQKFLDLAYRSLVAQSFQDFEIIHVSSGDFEPKTPTMPKKKKHIHINQRMHYPSAVECAYRHASKDSEFIFLMNDDVILHKDTIKTMLEISLLGDVIVNPMSSCCNGRFYQAPLGFTKNNGELSVYRKNQYKYDEMAPFANDIIERSLVHSSTFFYQHHVCFFATMMRRTTWDKLGGIDVNFKTGSDDEDMSIRARKLGIHCGIATGASVFHFSGSTADEHLTKEDREFNIKYFNEKHGIT